MEERIFSFVPGERLARALAGHRWWRWLVGEEARRWRIDAPRGYIPRFGEPVDIERVRRAVGERVGIVLCRRALERWKSNPDFTNIPLMSGKQFLSGVADELREQLQLVPGADATRLLRMLAGEIFEAVINTRAQNAALLAPPRSARLLAGNGGMLVILLVKEQASLRSSDVAGG